MVPRPLAPKIHSAKKGVLVLNGRSYFPNTWLVFYAVPAGPGKGICMWCDDKSVVARINSKHSKSPPRVMDLIRVITLQTLQYNFAFTATHIPGLDNSIADSLSHFRWTTPVPWLSQPPPSLHQRWTPEFLYSDIFMLTLPLPLDAPIKLASSTSSPLTSRMVFVMYHAMLWMALRGFKIQWILLQRQIRPLSTSLPMTLHWYPTPTHPATCKSTSKNPNLTPSDRATQPP